jgi:hypothetical protein
MDSLRLGRPDGPLRLEVSRPVDAPPAATWAVLTDTATWPRWGPSVRAVESTDREITAGTRGRVQTAAGVWLPFAVDTCADRRWTWRVAGVTATGHRVDRLGPARSRAVFEVPLWAAPYALVCWVALGRIARLAERAAHSSR